jgi:phage shock protein A
VEIKASCAGAMASKARVARAVDEARERADGWERKARLAVDKGREDLAREALQEKHALLTECDHRQKELEHFAQLIEQYQDDIRQLEEKLLAARNKHRILVQRHIHASRRMDAQTKIRRADHTDAFARFENFESRIDRMEADADLVNYKSKNALEEEFSKLEKDEDIDKELEQLKARMRKEQD